MTSLADYNNNPGNLRPPEGVTYEGQIGVDDNGFAVFQNKEYGKKALVNDIKTKIKHGLNTPEAFINKYSPEGDNDEDSRVNYKIHLAESLGLESTGDQFSEEDADKIADAIYRFEGGASDESDSKDASKENGEDEKPTVNEKPADSDKPIEDVPLSDERESPDVTLVGGAIGATKGAAIETAKGVTSLIKKYKNKASGSPVNLRDDLDLVVSESPDVAPYPENYPKPLGPRESTGTGTYNYGKRFGLTNTDAARAVDMSKGPGGVWDLSRKAAEAERKIQQGFGGYGFQGVPERSDLLLPTSRTVERGTVSPPIPGVTRAVQAAPRVVEEPWLSKQVGKVGQAAKTVLSNPWVGKPLSVAMSGVTGALSAKQLQDAYRQWVREGKGAPSWDTFVKAISGTGGVIGTVPTPLTRGIGLAMQAPELTTEAASAMNKYAPNPAETGGLPVFGQ